MNFLEANDCGDSLCRSKNLATVNANAVFARIIVNETDWAHAKLRIALHLTSDRAASAPGADDQHVAFIDAMLKSLRISTHREPRAADEKHGQREIDDQHRARIAAYVDRKFEQHVDGNRTDDLGLSDVER